jgi:F420H(2)-dependent quinone reductase
MFKLFQKISVWLYRLSKGRLGGEMRGFKVLLLTTTGRKSGMLHTLPLGRFDWNNGYLVVASNSGRPRHPSWYLNLQSHPQVTLQVLDQVMTAQAEILAGPARALAWQHVMSSAPFYAAYQKKTTREIPLVLLHPVR